LENDSSNNLMEIKLFAGQYNLTLKNYKDKLIERKSLLQQIENKSKTKKSEQVELRNYKSRMMQDLRKTTNQLNDIKALKDDYESPDVQDFLQVERQLQEMKKIIKRLNRQRKIQLFTIRTNKKEYG
jgi:hypothetical protein